jgi:PII-like signaling protein
VKIARKEKKAEPKQPHERRSGPAKLMRVFLGEADRWHDEPLYDAIVKRLRMMEVSGATVYRGILGYGAKGHTHKQNFLHLSRDLPVMISVVDSAEKITEAAAAIEAMLEDGLIVLSDVEMTRLVRSAPAEAAASAATPPIQREPAT